MVEELSPATDNTDMTMRHTRAAAKVLLAALILLVVTNRRANGSDAEGQTSRPGTPNHPGIQITIYPLLAQVPIFGAEANVPDLPDRPGASGSTDVSVNGAYMFGITIEGRRWLADANGLWAAVAANRTTPFTSIDSDTWFFNLFGGMRLAGRFFIVGGIRRVSTDLDISLTRPSETSALHAETKPALWDPMIGVDYRGRLGSKTRFDAVIKGGGFGVGTDIDVAAEGAINWRIVRHLEIRGGYSFLYYKVTAKDANVDGVQRTLVSRQTLHGPEIGIGIPF